MNREFKLEPKDYPTYSIIQTTAYQIFYRVRRNYIVVLADFPQDENLQEFILWKRDTDDGVPAFLIQEANFKDKTTGCHHEELVLGKMLCFALIGTRNLTLVPANNGVYPWVPRYKRHVADFAALVKHEEAETPAEEVPAPENKDQLLMF